LPFRDLPILPYALYDGLGIYFARRDVQMNTQLKCSLALAALLFTSITSLATCTATMKNADYSEISSTATSTLSTGTDGIFGKISRVSAVGDLVIVWLWCDQNCTFPSTVTVGSQTAIKISISSPGTTQDNNGNFTGQVAIYYVLSSTQSGDLTITGTVTGLNGGASPGTQISYIDFNISAGCVAAHDRDVLGTGVGGGTANTPSISGVSGELLYNAVAVGQHVNPAVNAPWSCPIYLNANETVDCTFDQTKNGQAYILSAGSGTISTNWGLNNAGVGWESIISSFTLTSGAAPPNPPTGLAAVVQ
jgi:hypothetical protein